MNAVPETTKLVHVFVRVGSPENRPYEIMIVALGSSHPFVNRQVEDREYLLTLTIPSWYMGQISVDVTLPTPVKKKASFEIVCGTLIVRNSIEGPNRRHGSACMHF